MPLVEDVFNVMMSPHHRLACREEVTLGDLSGERWVIDTASSTYTRVLTDACQNAGFTPDIIARCKGFEVTIALIREGCAIAIFPELRASFDLQDAQVCRLVPQIRRRISVAYRKGEKKSPALQAFIQSIYAHAAEFR